MNLSEDKVIGIVGGMGPQAGNALFESILRQSNAATDQHHLSVVMMSFPAHIPDRTTFLNGETPINPAISIVEVIRKLETAGAGIIGIACNTSYAPPIFDPIVEGLERLNSQVQLMHMPLETCRQLHRQRRPIRRVGVMATDGTYKAGVYTQLLQASGYEVVLPDWKFQHEVIHRMIYDPLFGIKACGAHIGREVKALLQKTIRYFGERRADAIILGCTEFSLVLTEKTASGMLLVDSTAALAKALINHAGYDRKDESDSRHVSINY